jgi:hypothetical protein
MQQEPGGKANKINEVVPELELVATFEHLCFELIRNDGEFKKFFETNLSPNGYLVRNGGAETTLLPSTQIPGEKVREELRAEARRLLAEKRGE